MGGPDVEGLQRGEVHHGGREARSPSGIDGVRAADGTEEAAEITEESAGRTDETAENQVNEERKN